VEKWKRLGLPITRTDRFRFLRAYAEKNEEMRKTMTKALQTYSFAIFSIDGAGPSKGLNK
jgi:hypothetical protein